MSVSSFADSDGVRIHCIDFGGAGPDMLLVHATGFHARTWEPVVDILRPHFRVTAMDVRGHGESGKADDYRWPMFAGDVIAAVEHLGLHAPIGVGHSSGGTALVLAQDVKTVFSRHVLFDPVMPPRFWKPDSSQEAQSLATTARKRRNTWDSPDQFFERLSSRAPLSDWRPDILRAYVEHGLHRKDDGTWELACPPEVEARIYEGNAHEGRRLLKHTSIPTLLMMFGDSYLWPSAEPNLGDNPMLSYAVLPGSHFAPMESPDAVWTAVLNWLGAT